ncbi:MAG: methyltransferase [Candidatus Thermoplasmatota archaeon]|nr:methyltransferase [Candidatus Thermoplasmatota archaeon]
MKTKKPYKTFLYNGLLIGLHPEVYEPAEDTFQLLEAIKIKKHDSVLEIGTGCGIIALECSRRGTNVVCTDVNPHAVEITKHNYLKNKTLLNGKIDVRRGDLFSVVKPNEKFDVIIFNPPYLPTKSEERTGGTGWFDVATDSGRDGLFLTRKFIREVAKYLREKGRAYFVFSSLADRKKLDDYLARSKLKSEVVLSRWFNDEQIDIYCLSN